jgi:2-hydroxycyclohexanecarboxyl-CoA dehydrogenase
MEFSGDYAVVTGGASGICRAVVEQLREAGCAVFIGDVDLANARAVAEATGASYARLDLCDPDSVRQFAEAVLDAFPRVDVLVNGAGWQKVNFFLDNEPELWERLVGVHMVGPAQLTQAMLPRMIEGGGGRIVNISSDAGRVGSQGEAFYSATKGGMIAFTKGLAREVARHRINVNCICPGPTDTPMFAAAPQKLREALERSIPFKRIGRPSEIADVVLFFASRRASYVTGQVLSVSGGLTMVG